MGTPATPIPMSPEEQAGHAAFDQYTQQQLVKQNNALQASIAAAAAKDPNITAEAQRLGLQVGVGSDIAGRNMDVVRKMALVQDVANRNLPQTAPRLAKMLEDPNFSGVAYDDLDNLSRVEQGAATLRAKTENPSALEGLTPTQRQAVIADRMRVAMAQYQSGGGTGALNRVWAEAQSQGGNFNVLFLGTVKTFIDAAGGVGQSSLESAKALLTPSDWDTVLERLDNIWNTPRTFAVQKLTDPAYNYMTARVLPAHQKNLIDPATQQPFANPDYRWYGRDLANSIEQVPGALAAYALIGALGGAAAEMAAPSAEAGLAGATGVSAAVERQIVPMILSTESAQNTYTAARAKGADQKSAVLAALSEGLSNYAFMGAMPGAEPTSTVTGAIGQWAGRSAAFGTGMTVTSNAIARVYDPDRGLFEGLPESIATMAAYEGAGAFPDVMGKMVDAAQASKLRARSPEAFQQAMNAQFEGDESLRIPAQDFVNYFHGKNLDPALMANHLGASNLDEAAAAGSDLEIPKANFFGRLDPEHQKGLLPDLVNPTTDLTARQTEAGKAELQDWIAQGGAAKLQAEYAQTDAETQATPEWQKVYSDLKQRYVDAGEKEPVAESYATLHANAIANLAKNAGLKPDELLALHNPNIVEGEAPGSDQTSVDYGEALTRYIKADPERAIAEYSRLKDTDGGRILNTDEARELSEHYRQDRTRSTDVHEAASRFIKNLYAKKLKEPVEEGRDPLVLFTAGGTGAGKSSALKTPEGAALQSRADIVYDTNMNNVGSAEKKIQQALDSGRDVAIQYTYREPVEALTGGTLPRAMRMGRTVPLENHLDTHIGSRKTMEALQRKYVDDPRVRFSFIDNSLGKDNQKAAKSLDSLPAIEENGLRERLQNALDGEYKAGRISEAVLRGTADRRRDVQGDAHARSSGGSRGIQSESPAADGREHSADVLKHVGQSETELADGSLGKSGTTASDILYQSGKSINGVDGKQSTLLTPNGKLPAKYRLVEASDLIPSHNPETFEVNKAYPEGVQERAYDKSKEAQARVIDQAQNYEPDYTVNTNPDAVNGPPVITPDGTVLGGNSRSMSTIRLYRDGRGDVYKDALRDHAGDYGLKPEDVDGMKEPVLVRQVEAPQSVDAMRRLATDLNRSMTGALGAAEKAVSVGKNIKPETLRWVSDELNAGDMTLREMLSSRGADVLKRMVQDGALTERERPQYVDAATGGLNEAGKSFVEKALLGTVIDDPRLMESAPKSIIAKIERSLGAITSFASRADEWNILPALREAINEHGAIQRSGSSVELRLGQTSMFGEERNPLVDSLVRALDEKPNAVKAAFDAYAHDSDENLPGQSRMFGEANAFDAFNHAFGSKLSEQEFNDELETARNEPSASAVLSGEDAGRDEGLSGSANRDEALGGQESVGGLRGGESNAGDESGAGSRSGAGGELSAATERPANDGVDSPNGKRGWFRILPDGRYEIGKTEIGDLSTFIHEPAHAYLEMFRELTQRDGASEPLKSDFKKICDWLGTTPENAYSDGFTREQHEQWARANEEYVREGKAPTSGLKRAFHNFAVWMGSIYRRASALGVELSGDVRGVMDRLYAGDSAVDRAEQEAPRRLFENPEEAGWTEEEYKKYAESKGLEVTEAKTQLIREMHEAWLREKTQAWREEKGNVRDAVTQEIDARPEYRAIRSLRRGTLDDGTELTLNRDELVKQFGEERVKALQDVHRGLYRQEGGTDAETAAEIFGYGSGEEMMRTLEATTRRAPAIEAATRDYMTAKHGDIRYDGSLDDKARLAMENDERAKNLHTELAALKKKLADTQQKLASFKAPIEIAPLEQYQEAARQMIAGKSIADLQPNRYLNASRMFSREAFDARGRGDVQRAAEAKNKELLNHFLYREAAKAQEYVGKFESYAKRMQSVGVQQRLGLADVAVKKAGEVGDYRDQHNWLLARYKMNRWPPQAPERSLRAWAEDMNSQLKEPAIAPDILNEGRFADYRKVPLSEVHDLHDALINVKKLATAELEASINGKRMQFEQMANELVAEMRANLPATPEKYFEQPMTRVEKARDFARSVDVSASRMEFLIDKAGGGLRGAWRKYVWEPYQNAKGDEYAMQADWTKRLNDQIEAESVRQGLRLSDRVTVDGISASETLTRKELVSIALNMGNESNYDRLQKTFIDRNFDPKALVDIGGKLTADEWRFVQAIGDSLKPWGERMNAFEKEQSGLAPKMVEVKPFKVVSSDGVEMNLDGWYYPVKYDPRYVLKGQEQESSKIARSLMESGYGRATTSRGYTKERTGYAGPLLLDYERVLTEHIAKVTKDLSHREFAQNTYRLLTHPDVRQALRECLGPKYDQEAMSWLRATVNDRNGSVDGGADDMRYMEKLRSNLVKASLAYKASTAVLQFTHLSRLMLFTKPGSFTSAMVDFWKNPAKMTETIRELSPNVMRFRGEHLDRDFNATLEAIAGKKDPVSAAVRLGYAPMKYIDHAISFPLWLSVYNDALLKNGPEMETGESHTAAMHAADSAVRMGLGDASKGDLPPIMRSPEMLKKIESTLYGFENVNYNIMRHKVAGEAQRSWRAGNYAAAAGGLAFGSAMAFFVPALMSAYVRGDGPKDGENPGLWAAKRSLFFAGGTIPWVKDGLSLFEHGSLNPMASWAQKIRDEATQHAREGEMDWTGIGIDSMQAIGDTLGLPGTDQATHTMRYVHRTNQGKVDNPSVYGAVVGGR